MRVMDPHEQDEDVTGIIRALHARMDVLEASFFSKVTDAAKKAASAAANTANKAVDYVIKNEMNFVAVSEHLRSTFPDMKIYDFTQFGSVQQWVLIYRDKQFFLKEDYRPWRRTLWKFMNGMRIKKWIDDHTPKVLDLNSIKVDRFIYSFEELDKYIQEHAP